MATATIDLTETMRETAAAVDRTLDGILPAPAGPEARFQEAMRYGVLGAGKRLRPFLALESARMFGVDDRHALRAGAAIELVHAYSLVHDDLPAMDDDDLRRGRPTVHVAYDEATAILVGDALATLAFEALADPATHPDPAVRVALVQGLAAAAGPRGMVAGQVLDLAGREEAEDYGSVVRLERLKTGALITFACECGAILAGADAHARAALFAYGQDVGLAFQIADDLLDIEGNEEETGKRVGKDDGAGRATIVSLLGVEAARAEAGRLIQQADAHLARFGDRAGMLRAVARFVVERRS